jgi:hypothetical protein
MMPHEFDAFQQLMADLCAAFDKPPTDERVRVFWQALKGYPMEQIKGRVRYWCSAKEKFPTPVQLAPQDETVIDDSKPNEHPLKDLIEWIPKNRKLTPLQYARPWNHIVRWYDAPDITGKMRKNHGVEFLGIEVPADGDAPGFRVMKNEI